MPGASGPAHTPHPYLTESIMRRSRFSQSLFAVAAMAAPVGVEPFPVIDDMQQIAGRECRAGEREAVTLDLWAAIPEPPVVALLAAGLALGLARGSSGLRRPVRRRRG